LVENLKKNIGVAELASITLKLIFTLGVICSNIEDYLVVLKFVQKYPELAIDLTPELNMCYKFYGFTHKPPSETKDESQFTVGKQNILTSIPISNLITGGTLFELRSTQGDRMVSDS
jgi:hypothetical protein